MPENLENAILFVDYFKEAFAKHLSANEKYAHQALATLLQIDLQLTREGRDKIIAEIQTITKALPRISEDTRASREILERIERKIRTGAQPQKPHLSEARVFISYSRKDGATFANELRLKLEAQNIPQWQDRVGMEGGKDWWLQIVEALNKVEFMVLIMTPKAMESDIIRKEWRYASSKKAYVSIPSRPCGRKARLRHPPTLDEISPILRPGPRVGQVHQRSEYPLPGTPCSLYGR